MQIIETTAAPSRPKLFSQAIAANGLLFVSGQLPMRVAVVGPAGPTTSSRTGSTGPT